tara:strand:+ start:182616 stop:184715 length:2100 start_codon:yes stop_codon:yes gene_type:complete
MQKTLLAFTFAAPALLQAAPVALEEIRVTAEFRDVSLQQQPASTTVLTTEAITQRAAQSLQDVLNVAPNVNFSSGTSRARYFQVRGIGERSQFQEPLNPSVGLLIDGIDYSSLGVPATLFDIAQVEVLRGPQGTLHGANALAGLINIRTAEPAAQPLLRVEATLADYNTASLGVAGSGPFISDTLLYRLAVSGYRSDGFTDNEFLGRDDTSERDEINVRGKLRWLLNATNTLDLTVLHADIDNGYDAFSLDNTRETLSDEPGRDRLDSNAVALGWHRQGDSFTLEATVTAAVSDTDYSFDEDWSFVGIAPDLEYSSRDRYLRDRDSVSAELRLLSTEQSRLFNHSTDWVAGLYYLSDTEDLTRQYTYLESDFSSDYDTRTFAVFGQFDTAIGENLTLISGLRAEQRATRYSDSNGVDEDPDKNLWGARLTLEYQPDDQSLWYAGVSRGYRANGVNANILASLETVEQPDASAALAQLTTYDEESLINYELGYKARFAQDALRTRLTLFYMDRKDQQVKGSFTLPRQDGSTAFIDYTNNAAQGSNYGLELEAEWQALESLQLYGNIGVLETEFDSYINADGVDLSGREQAQAPAYQYALGGQLALGAGYYLRVDAEGKDDFYFSDRHDVKAPDYHLLHLRLGYDAQRWSIAMWVRNLTDEDYFVRGFGSFGNDPRKEYALEPYYQYGEPRLIGVSASMDF